MLENGEGRVGADVVDLQQAGRTDLRDARGCFLERVARVSVGGELRREHLDEHRSIEHTVAREPHGSERRGPLLALQHVPIAEHVARCRARGLGDRHWTFPVCVESASRNLRSGPMCWIRNVEATFRTVSSTDRPEAWTWNATTIALS